MADGFDVRLLKIALNRLGYYTPPKDTGLQEFTDAGMFAALETFQKDRGLAPSGAIRPGDKTEAAIDRAIDDQPVSAKYVWRTCGDDKVRSEHAARDGEIFSWITPPKGGHPGSDHNCRCWAEPVKLSGRELQRLQDVDLPVEPVYPELLMLPFLRGGNAVSVAWKLWLKANKRDPEWTLGAHKKPDKWARQMEQRGWTPERISDTIRQGKQYSAPNHVNKSNAATRYEYNGRYLVRDDRTKEILQVGGENFIRPRMGE